MPDTEACQGVAELTVAVRGLVEVHEVEVDVRPRQGDVRLRVQVQQRLCQRLQTTDPHLRGAEGVHPGGDADDLVVGARLDQGAADAVGVLQDRLPDELDRQGAGQLGVHGLALLLHLAQRLLAVQPLGAGEEPDLVAVERGLGVDGDVVRRGVLRHRMAPSGFCP
ncbi:hypothetical protein QP157_09305 [Sphingomonas sp. LR61]